MHLLFDLDGTLTDPFVGITKCIQHALGALDREVPPADDLRWCIGPPLHHSFLTLLKTTDHQLASRALEIYRERFGRVGLFENTLYPGVVGCLQELSQERHRLSVATSKPTVFAEQIVDHFELTEYFRSVDGSELDGTRCEKASLISHVLERDGLNAEGVVMIGDRKYDMIGAAANGVLGIGVLWGYGSIEELRDAGASQCVDLPGKLPAAIKEAEQDADDQAAATVGSNP